jgi:two-component system, LytTR family, response regulator
MQVLIIEDEAPAVRQLVALLQQVRPQWSVIKVIDSVEASVLWLQSNAHPDLILMDIQLADGLSFSIFDQVTIQSEVVFCTAFNQYAVEAFKRHAVHYLLKPIEVSDLEDACLRLEQKQTQTPQHQADILASIVAQLRAPQYKDRFLVKSGSQLALLETRQIAWFRSSGGLTEAYLQGGKRHIIDHTLDELEHLLDPAIFFRASRQYFVSLTCLGKIHPHLNGRLKLELNPSTAEDVYVSRERVHDFKAWLGG